MATTRNPDHAVVICLIAKCPIAGQSKTRLQPFLDAHGSALLARAMLLDVLCSVTAIASNSPNKVDLLLFYAPPTKEGQQIMASILQEQATIQDLASQWTHLPVNYYIEGDESVHTPTTFVRSSNLSSVLTNAVQTAYERHSVPTTVILLGMDVPELPLAELRTLIHPPTPTTSALLCPAMDGGYVLLSIPPGARSHVDRLFFPVHPYWSHPWTALAQIKALSDVGITTVLGPIVSDIDTPDDLKALMQRCSTLEEAGEYGTSRDSSLHRPSWLVVQEEEPTNQIGALVSSRPSCPHTRQALMELQLILPKDA